MKSDYYARSNHRPGLALGLLLLLALSACSTGRVPADAGGSTVQRQATPESLWWEKREPTAESVAETEISLQSKPESRPASAPKMMATPEKSAPSAAPPAEKSNMPGPTASLPQNSPVNARLPHSPMGQPGLSPEKKKSSGRPGNCQVNSSKFFKIQGPLPAAELLPLVEARIPRLCSCYLPQMKQNPSLFEAIRLEITVNERGGIEQLLVKDASFSVGGQVIACILDKLGTWRVDRSYPARTSFTLLLEYLQ